MINNCYDLLRYIHENSEHNFLSLSPNTHKSLGISNDELDLYSQQLINMGYAKRQIRSITLTPDGIDSLH